jgi:DNA-binding transcriptional LysR family regulator
MDKLNCMRAFVSVVESGGFSESARRLGVSKALISKQINQLEESLNVRLLHRTTRKVSPTSSGQAYFEQCRPILNDLDELDAFLQASDASLKGEIRIAAPITYAEMHLIPIISLYARQNPEVTIKLDLTDRFVNLVEERIDLAIRIGDLEESSLVSRRIGEIRMLLCASPAYLQQYGAPGSIQALAEHHCVLDSNYPEGNHWHLVSGDTVQSVRIHDQIQVNNARAASDLVIDGSGIGYLPSFVVEENIQQGKLVQVLENYSSSAIAINAVYLHRKHLSPKVRRLMDLFIDKLTTKPGSTA